DALRHHAARDGDRDRRRFQRGRVLVVEVAVQLARVRVAAEAVRVRDAARAQRVELRATLLDQVVVVVSHLVLFGFGADYQQIAAPRAPLPQASLLRAAMHYRPDFSDASMNSSRSPSSTAVVLPTSTPVRRSLMRDWSSTYERIWLPQ